MNKVIRDGKVAVLYSPGFGAGWSTWLYNDATRLKSIFEPRLVEAVERNASHEEIAVIAKETLGENFFTGGVEDLTICWIPVGTCFDIDEYQGSESIRVCPLRYIA